ncbi:MAG: PEP-CTERM sorting domain-containing protein [Candidatus Scalindua sp.]|jgi:autotransporter-associated beta strand protein|nr:PEP-CTERM sorting domain-containing protein [Candidatus Scalindua sp.]MBT5306979.1 PEP-CTERM sorting domain-containing protein [Candidatus Scalindua sp.]MBT6226152.1 PEP-CTERM sorting domain-containing protein [Candidatus Scalindua sp.]MBT7210433.1 PEP-CTERM sorting domain-containing protein [Candidatus Scalindua sp.]
MKKLSKITILLTITLLSLVHVASSPRAYGVESYLTWFTNATGDGSWETAGNWLDSEDNLRAQQIWQAVEFAANSGAVDATYNVTLDGSKDPGGTAGNGEYISSIYLGYSTIGNAALGNYVFDGTFPGDYVETNLQSTYDKYVLVLAAGITNYRGDHVFNNDLWFAGELHPNNINIYDTTAGEDTITLNGRFVNTPDNNSLEFVTGDIDVNGSIGGVDKLILAGDNSLWKDTKDLSLNTGAIVEITNPLALRTKTDVFVDGNSTLRLLTATEFGSLTGSGSLVLGDNGTIGASNTDHAFTGVISGAGGFTKTGTGVLTLSANNTYSGGTSINGGGTLAISSDSNLGNANGSLSLSNGTLRFDNSFNLSGTRAISLSSGSFDTNGNNTTISQALSGNSLRKLGDGTLTLTGANTYIGGTYLYQGSLALGNNSAAGTSTIVVQNGGATIAYTPDINITNAITLTTDVNLNVSTGTATQSGLIQDPGIDIGSINKTGGGTLILKANNAYDGGTTISDGTLQIGTGGNNGSIRGNGGVTNNGSLVFNRGNDLSFGGAISGTGSVSQSGAGTLTLTGNNTYAGGTNINNGTLAVSADAKLGDTSGSLSFDGGSLLFNGAFDLSATRAITLNAGGGDLNTNGNNPTISQAIGGSGGLTKSGNGILALTGTNTYGGNTTINGGVLQIGNGGTSGSITGDVTNNGMLTINRSNDLTLGGVISGTGIMAKNGAGTLTLSGNNSYAGGTTFSSGGLKLTKSNAAGSGDIIVDGGNKITFSGSGIIDVTNDIDLQSDVQLQRAGSGDSIHSGIISETGGNFKVTKVGSGTLKITGSNTYSGGTNINYGTLAVLADNGLGNANGSLTFDGGALRFDNAFNLASNRAITLNAGGGDLNTNGNNTTISQTIDGLGGLTKSGTGTLALTGTNTYGGNTTINGGELQIGNGSTSGSITGDVTNDGMLTFDRSNNLTFDNVINGTGGLTKKGAGRLTLSGNNSYAGGTTFSDGKLKLTNSNAAGSGDITVLGGTAINIDANLDIANDIDLQSNVVFQRDGGDSIYSGVISETGGSFKVHKSGAGLLTLTGENTHTGGTTISNGVLQLGNNGSITGSITNNASLIFNRDSNITLNGNISGTGNVTIMDSIVRLSGNHTYTGGTTISGGTLQLGNGGINGSILGDVTNNSILDFRTEEDQAFGGNISGTGRVVKFSSRTLTLNGSNTYSGGTTVNKGTLSLANSSAAGTGDITIADDGAAPMIAYGDGVNIGNNIVLQNDSRLNMDNGSGTQSGIITDSGTGKGVIKDGAGTLTLTGNNSYSGGTTISAGALQIGNGGTTGSITGDVTNDASLIFNLLNDVTYSDVISGTGNITQSGAGSLALTNANTYLGMTTVNSGTLLVNNSSGSATGTGAVVVNSGATLGGNGFIDGPVTINSGGAIAPGMSPGTMNWGSGILEGGGSLLWEINDADGIAGTDWDLISIVDTLSITATDANPFLIDIDSLLPNNNPGLLANFDYTQDYSWTLFTTGGGISGFSADAFMLDYSGFFNNLGGGSFFINQTGNSVSLDFNAVPEPSTILLLGIGLAGLAGAEVRRRRKKRAVDTS